MYYIVFTIIDLDHSVYEPSILKTYDCKNTIEMKMSYLMDGVIKDRGLEEKYKNGYVLINHHIYENKNIRKLKKWCNY